MLLESHKIIRILPCLADPEKMPVIAELPFRKEFETNYLKLMEGVDPNG